MISVTKARIDINNRIASLYVQDCRLPHSSLIAQAETADPRRPATGELRNMTLQVVSASQGQWRGNLKRGIGVRGSDAQGVQVQECYLIDVHLSREARARQAHA